MDILLKLPSLFDILSILILVIALIAGFCGKKAKKWWHFIFVLIAIIGSYVTVEVLSKDNKLYGLLSSIGPVEGILNTISSYVPFEFTISLVNALVFWVLGIVLLILVPLIGDIIVSICSHKKPKKTAWKTFGIPSVLSAALAWLFILLPFVTLRPILNSLNVVIDAQFSNKVEGAKEGMIESKISSFFNGSDKLGDIALKQFDSVTFDIDEKVLVNLLEKTTSLVKKYDYVTLSYAKDSKTQDLFGALADMIKNPEMVPVLTGLLSAESLSSLPSDFIPKFTNGLCCTILTLDDTKVDAFVDTFKGLIPLLSSLAGESAGTMLNQMLSDFTYDIDGDGDNETINLIHFMRDHIKLDETDPTNISKADFVFEGSTSQEKKESTAEFLNILLCCLFDNQNGSGKVNFVLACAQQTIFYKIDITTDGELSYCPTYDTAYELTDLDTSNDLSQVPKEGKFFNNAQFNYLGMVFFTKVFPL